MARWLALDHPHCSSGEWSQEGARLEFAQADHPGGVGYSITHYRARVRADGSLEVERRGRPNEDPQRRSYAFLATAESGGSGSGLKRGP